MGLVRRLMLALVVFGACLLVAEGALRVASDRLVLTSEWLLEHPEILDPEAIFAPEATRGALGPGEDGRPLLVTLGDSFTRGHPVGRADAYPAVLARRLAAGGTPVRLLDLGLGDSGPDQQLRWLERELAAGLRPDGIVWQLYPNDVWDNVTKAVYGIEGDRLVPLDVTRSWIHRRQRAYAATPAADLLRRRSHLYRLALRTFELGETSAVPAAYARDPRAWGLRKIALAVRRMDTLARHHRFALHLVLVAPQAVYVEGADSEEAARLAGFAATWRRMRAVLADEPGFLDAHFPEAEGLFVEAGRDGQRLGGRHFGEAGYRRLADLVLERLHRDGAFEPER